MAEFNNCRPSIGQLRAGYFAENDFGSDGGYSNRWVFLEFGPLRLPLYNSAARRQAVPIHDLHHLITGYTTTPQGEAEIASWELAAGTYDKWFALLINLPALLYGLAIWPRRTLDAWRAGSKVMGLYAHDFQEAWLLQELHQLQDIALQPKPVGVTTPSLFGYVVLATLLMLIPATGILGVALYIAG
ncbi:MAG: hypothetical protein AAF529_14445 [Pseudomonadota bacterium]